VMAILIFCFVLGPWLRKLLCRLRRILCNVNVNDKILNIAHITIKDICALHLSKFELQQTISNFKKVSLELSLEGSGSRYVAEIWR
jgi:hypothetical protein